MMTAIIVSSILAMMMTCAAMLLLVISTSISGSHAITMEAVAMLFPSTTTATSSSVCVGKCLLWVLQQGEASSSVLPSAYFDLSLQLDTLFASKLESGTLGSGE